MDDERVREILERVRHRSRVAFEALLRLLRRMSAPVVALWARLTIARWERMQRFFSDHSDLVDFDGWLDRWYSFGTA